MSDATLQLSGRRLELTATTKEAFMYNATKGDDPKLPLVATATAYAPINGQFASAEMSLSGRPLLSNLGGSDLCVVKLRTTTENQSSREAFMVVESSEVDDGLKLEVLGAFAEKGFSAFFWG